MSQQGPSQSQGVAVADTVAWAELDSNITFLYLRVLWVQSLGGARQRSLKSVYTCHLCQSLRDYGGEGY